MISVGKKLSKFKCFAGHKNDGTIKCFFRVDDGWISVEEKTSLLRKCFDLRQQLELT